VDLNAAIDVEGVRGQRRGAGVGTSPTSSAVPPAAPTPSRPPRRDRGRRPGCPGYAHVRRSGAPRQRRVACPRPCRGGRELVGPRCRGCRTAGKWCRELSRDDAAVTGRALVCGRSRAGAAAGGRNALPAVLARSRRGAGQTPNSSRPTDGDDRNPAEAAQPDIGGGVSAGPGEGFMYIAHDHGKIVARRHDARGARGSRRARSGRARGRDEMYHLPMNPAVPGSRAADSMETARAKASHGRRSARPARSSIRTSLSRPPWRRARRRHRSSSGCRRRDRRWTPISPPRSPPDGDQQVAACAIEEYASMRLSDRWRAPRSSRRHRDHRQPRHDLRPCAGVREPFGDTRNSAAERAALTPWPERVIRPWARYRTRRAHIWNGKQPRPLKAKPTSSSGQARGSMSRTPAARR